MTAMPASISTMDSPISSPDTKSCTSEPPADICSAVYEVVQKRPEISAREAIASGFAVGRAACGSTTTTLLLAYSGSYVALMMVFMAQGTPVGMMLNYKYVAAEIVHTVVGSFGLVTVAPLTAITSGLLLTGKNK